MSSFCKHMICALFLAAMLQILITDQAKAQQSESSVSIEHNFDVGFSTVYSPNSFAAWGKIENSSSVSFRGQVWHTRLNWKGVDARMGSEMILTHRLNYPVNGIDGPRDERTGFGIIPVNVLAPITNLSRFRPFAFFSAGGIFLNDKLPVGNGASLNYLLNLGTGVEIPFFDHSKLHVGYSIQHMSNANTGEQNPGIDSHSFFLTIIIP